MAEQPSSKPGTPRESFAWHEAGHTTVALTLGEIPECVWIDGDKAFHPGVRRACAVALPKDPTRQAVYLAAGIEGESLQDRSCRYHLVLRARRDYDMIEERGRRLGHEGDDLDVWIRQREREASHAIERCRPLFDAIVQQLISDGVLGKDQLLALARQHGLFPEQASDAQA